MKFIYKIPHGYFSGGAYFKYAPTVNSSAWSANNLLVWITPKDISSGSPTITLAHCPKLLITDEAILTALHNIKWKEDT